MYYFESYKLSTTIPIYVLKRLDTRQYRLPRNSQTYSPMTPTATVGMRVASRRRLSRLSQRRVYNIRHRAVVSLMFTACDTDGFITDLLIATPSQSRNSFASFVKSLLFSFLRSWLFILYMWNLKCHNWGDPWERPAVGKPVDFRTGHNLNFIGSPRFTRTYGKLRNSKHLCYQIFETFPP